MTMLIKRGNNYEEVCASFRWNIPEFFNIADDVCDRWADGPERLALVYENEGGQLDRYTFQKVRNYANQLANTFLDRGLQRGDRVMMLLAQDPECAIAHIACWKAGIVSSPCSVLFGPEAIRYRMKDCEVSAVITNMANYPKIAEIWSDCPLLEHVLIVDGEPEGTENFWKAIEEASEQFDNVKTRAEDIAWISYTSGTTGMPKGAVQPHRVLLGNMPGSEFIYDFFPDSPVDVTWSPADWAWVAGLVNVLMASWYHGCTVIGTAMKGFNPEEAYRVLDQYGVTLAVLTPTTLKLMRGVADASQRYKLKLRAVVSGSEAVGAELHEWAERELGITLHEAFGQTECNSILGNNGNIMPIKPGALGRALPGTVAAIIDNEGNVLPVGSIGNIAIRRPHPNMFKEYLNLPKDTQEKFIGDWLVTGDLGYVDEDGYFWFHGRGDDVITSSGYRIGPGEIEDALINHPAVRMAAVIGVPDPVRTEVIKAFLALADGFIPSDALAEEIRDTVRERLARHEVPRLIEFVDSIPLGVTGKILRRELREQERKKEGE